MVLYYISQRPNSLRGKPEHCCVIINNSLCIPPEVAIYGWGLERERTEEREGEKERERKREGKKSQDRLTCAFSPIFTFDVGALLFLCVILVISRGQLTKPSLSAANRLSAADRLSTHSFSHTCWSWSEPYFSLSILCQLHVAASFHWWPTETSHRNHSFLGGKNWCFRTAQLHEYFMYTPDLVS